MAQEAFRSQPDITAPYGTTNNKQARGSDGSFGHDGSSNFSYRTNASGGATADQSLGNNDGIGTNDDVSLSKLYHYKILITGVANAGNEGTVGDKESQDSTLTIDSSPKGLQTERSNMRFSAIKDNLGIMGNIYEFRVATSGVQTSGANAGTASGNVPEYHVYYEQKPIWRVDDTTTLTHADAVKRAVATAIATAKTELREVWYTGTAGAHGDHAANTHHYSPAQPITGIRQSVTAAAISTVSTLEAAGSPVIAVTAEADSAT